MPSLGRLSSSRAVYRYNLLMLELTHIDDECIRCGLCLRQQAAECMPEMMCGDLALELANASVMSEVSSKACEFLLSCSLCDACTVHCPQFISCAQLVKAGRERLLSLQPESLQASRPYRVDFRENQFAALRKAIGARYEDALDTRLQDEGERSLFFPGCSLSSYSEELTKTTYELLRERGVVQGMSVYCCGVPLSALGAREAYQQYSEGFIKRLRRQKVTRLVIACPDCFYSLSRMLKQAGANDITLEVLPEILLELGVSCPENDYASVSVHDSCHDRFDLRFAQATRALMLPGGVEVLEMENQGNDTICCGAGGFAQVGGPALSAERRNRRLRQYATTGAGCLVCSCMSCVNTFLSHDEAPETRHYLELLFGISIDWHAVQLAFDNMSVEDWATLTLPPAESTKVFDD